MMTTWLIAGCLGVVAVLLPARFGGRTFQGLVGHLRAMAVDDPCRSDSETAQASCGFPAPGSGFTAVVTGGCGGVGLATVERLARPKSSGGEGASSAVPATMVIALCRPGSASFAEARRRLAATSAVRFVEVDLGSLASVRAAAEGVRRLLTPTLRTAPLTISGGTAVASSNAASSGCSGGGHLDLLVLNAAHVGPFESSVDGFEMALAVGHLAHFELTRLLLPLLRRSLAPSYIGDENPGHVITVTSGMHHMADARRVVAANLSAWRGPATSTRPKLQGSSGGLGGGGFSVDMPGWALAMEAGYADVKLLNVLFALELQRRLDNDDHNGGGDVCSDFDSGGGDGKGQHFAVTASNGGASTLATLEASKTRRRVVSNLLSFGSTATGLNRRIPAPWRWAYGPLAALLFQAPGDAAAAVVALAARLALASSGGRGKGVQPMTPQVGGRLFTCFEETPSWLSPTGRSAAAAKRVWALSEEATGGVPFL